MEIVADVLEGQGGVRMTGGGFGGCVVALLPGDRVGHVVAEVKRKCRAATGLQEQVYPTGAAVCVQLL